MHEIFTYKCFCCGCELGTCISKVENYYQTDLRTSLNSFPKTRDGIILPYCLSCSQLETFNENIKGRYLKLLELLDNLRGIGWDKMKSWNKNIFQSHSNWQEYFDLKNEIVMEGEEGYYLPYFTQDDFDAFLRRKNRYKEFTDQGVRVSFAPIKQSGRKYLSDYEKRQYINDLKQDYFDSQLSPKYDLLNYINNQNFMPMLFIPMFFRLVRISSLIFIYVDGLSNSKLLIGLLVLRYFFDRSRKGANMFMNKYDKYREDSIMDYIKYSKEHQIWSNLTLLADILITVLVVLRLL